MPELYQPLTLRVHMDRYLEANGRSELSVLHVLGVLEQFDKQVGYLVQVALQELTIPQTAEGATILQFRPRAVIESDPAPDSAA